MFLVALKYKGSDSSNFSGVFALYAPPIIYFSNLFIQM